jgi:RNA polymerase sigma factor (sigma-70 family)
MTIRQPAVMRSIEQLFRQGPVAGLDDGELLDRFVSRHDDAAFAALVALHGPLVLGVCGRILRDPHDIEDAFQATFLVLVRRAGSIRDAGRLGPWLHGVARRVAMRARSEATRRRSHYRDRPASAEEYAVRPEHQAENDDLLGIIDQEVDRLPASFRNAVVLCDLEGRSYAEAARRLHCPLGTLQSRLARGRARLRSRLIRRGVAPGALAVFLAEGASAAVPEALAAATVRGAVATAIGKTAMAGTISATAAAVASSVARSMLMSMIQRVVFVCAAVSVAIGAGLVARDARSDAPAPPLAVRAEQLQPAEGPKPVRTLNLEVVSGADRSPLPGARVWIRVTWGKSRIARGTTDDEGRFPIELTGDANDFVQVAVAHPGFVAVEHDRYRSEMPDTFTVALERGVPIGGTVRDEQGRPIAGARVLPKAGKNAPRDWPELAASPDDVAARTDARGRWRSDVLPAGVGPNIHVLVTHPDAIPIDPVLTLEEARAETSVQVLKPGRSVSGTVTSPTGRPIAGADVILLNRHGNGRFTRVSTDAAGRFHTGRFIDPAWDGLGLTVQAEGFASNMRQLTITPEIPPQIIRLTPRRPLHGRVVDSQGRPIAGAGVRPSDPYYNSQFDWEAKSDADGRFVWFEAPTQGPVRLNASKSPFRPAAGREIDAVSREVTIVLHRPQHLHGTVTDAEDGRPVARFTLILGSGPPLLGFTPRWARDQARAFTDGRFDLTCDPSTEEAGRCSIRIEADGYEPAELREFLDSEEDVAHDFKLRRNSRRPPLTGIVRDPAGRPLAGVDVVLCLADDDVRIANGRLDDGHGRAPATRLRTDRDGRYTFRPQEGRISIAAANDAGFAVRSPEELAASPDITLTPWGRIEGVMKIGPRPAPRQKVRAWLHDLGPFGRVDYDALTDDDGRFVLERVTPGRLMVYRYVQDADHHGWTASNPANVDVQPGETLRIQVGGTGRPIVGRLGLPEGVALAHFVLGHGGNLSTERTGPPTPDDYPDYSDDQRSAWWDAFRKTREGRAYFEGAEREYAIAIHPDGSFRIEDVPAGRYVLKLPFTGNTGGDRSARIAFTRVDVVVPEVPGGRSDVPLDIGVIPLDVFPFRELAVGDRVPEITARAVDGRPLDLASMRGKFVMLAFWATYHGPTRASIPYLKATHDAFGRDPRFVMIGLNEDVHPDIMRRYVAHHHLAWEQRYLGSGDDPNPIAAAFGVRYPINVFLIGPDGRILAKDLQGERIKEAVAAALAKAR